MVHLQQFGKITHDIYFIEIQAGDEKSWLNDRWITSA